MIGYAIQVARINGAMTDIRRELDGESGGSVYGQAEAAREKRTMSIEVRKRMAAAQRKRWAEKRAAEATE